MLNEYKTGAPLSYSEFNILISTPISSEYYDDYTLERYAMSAEEYDAIPTEESTGSNYDFAQKPVWVDLNGDGQTEIVIITRVGGGSEGGSLYAYSLRGGVYAEIFDFYIGMHNTALITECDGTVFIVVRVPGDWAINPEVSPDENGRPPPEVYDFEIGFKLLRYRENWSRDEAFLWNGELSEWDYDWTQLRSGQ